MAVTQYIGARYVPLFAEPMEWTNTKQYEPLTIVLYQGNSFTSKQFVPIGVDITNENFWAETGNYNAQVEQYRREVLDFADSISEKTFGFDTVAGMQASDALYAGAICHTNGFYTNDDGGGAWYIITNVGIPNGMDILSTNNSLYASLLNVDEINSKMFGCTGALSDLHASEKLNRMFELCTSWNKTAVIQEGEYLIRKSLVITCNVKSYGVFITPATIEKTPADDSAYRTNAVCHILGENLKIEGITIEPQTQLSEYWNGSTTPSVDGTNYKHNGLVCVRDSKNITITNCDVNVYGSAIFFYSSHGKNCTVINSSVVAGLGIQFEVPDISTRDYENFESEHILNCNVIANFAMLHGSCKNVLVENTTIKNRNDSKTALVSFTRNDAKTGDYETGGTYINCKIDWVSTVSQSNAFFNVNPLHPTQQDPSLLGFVSIDFINCVINSNKDRPTQHIMNLCPNDMIDFTNCRFEFGVFAVSHSVADSGYEYGKPPILNLSNCIVNFPANMTGAFINDDNKDANIYLANVDVTYSSEQASTTTFINAAVFATKCKFNNLYRPPFNSAKNCVVIACVTNTSSLASFNSSAVYKFHGIQNIANGSPCADDGSQLLRARATTAFSTSMDTVKAGDMCFDTTTHTMKLYNGTEWVES